MTCENCERVTAERKRERIEGIKDRMAARAERCCASIPTDCEEVRRIRAEHEKAEAENARLRDTLARVETLVDEWSDFEHDAVSCGHFNCPDCTMLNAIYDLRTALAGAGIEREWLLPSAHRGHPPGTSSKHHLTVKTGSNL